ncbi:MAG: DNA alkylation repair protein [Prevotella sp.]|nr:DNA alkylation repair protein [Prevotella sp.]
MTNEKIKEIKQSFRLMMNGTASRSMREKGADYKLNWGVSLPDLQAMAEEIGKDYELAISLWKEDVRECKILATMLMPPEKMLPEVAEIWMEQTNSQEMAEIAAFQLYQHLDFASILAFRWMASDKMPYLVCAYQILARLFAKGQEPNERGINEYLDQVAIALGDEHAGVRRAAYNSVVHFTQLGEDYEKMARKALDLDFL